MVKPRYVGVAQEATFKTVVQPTKYLDVAECNIEPDQGWIFARRSFARARKKTKLGKFLASGRIGLGAVEPENGIGESLKWTLGTVATVGNLVKAGGGDTTLSANEAAGQTELSVASVANFAPNDYCQIGTGGTAECRKITAVGADTITVDKAIEFDHSSGEAVKEIDESKGFTHTFKGADDLPSFSAHVGIDVDELEYPGCLSDSLNLRVEDEFLEAIMEAISCGLTVNATIAASPVVSDLAPFAYHEGALKIPKGGSALDDWRSFEFSVRNQLIRDRRSGGSRFVSKKAYGERLIEGTVVIDFGDLNEFDTFIAGTETSLDLKFTGPEIASGYNYELEIELPRIVYVTDCKPGLRGREPSDVTCAFAALYSASDGYDVKVTLKNKQPYFI